MPGPPSQKVLASDSWLLLLLCWMQHILQTIRAGVTGNGQVVAGTGSAGAGRQRQGLSEQRGGPELRMCWCCCCTSTCKQQRWGGVWTDTQMVPGPLTTHAAVHVPRVFGVYLPSKYRPPPVTSGGCL